MKRTLEAALKKDLGEKIILLSGPRQTGKTTLSKGLAKHYEYLNYDAASDRALIARREWNRAAELVIFDELHKMKKWKPWIKGVYDTDGIPPALVVTGSARLNTYRKGGDSLAGRHYLYRLHPFTVREVAHEVPRGEALDLILNVGGFPEPFLKGNAVAAARWRRGHLDTILREDLIDLSRVRDIRSIETLIELLRPRVGSSTSYSSLANDLQTSVHTVKHWLEILEDLFVIFAVRPYHKNIARSLLKEAKYYFYDTGAVGNDPGARLENAVACALLAELQLAEDLTGCKTALHYLRDREKREVDFLTVINGRPNQMTEVKWNDDNFSKPLFYFKPLFHEISAFQVVAKLTRRKSNNGVTLLAAADFLADLDFVSIARQAPKKISVK